MATCLVEITEDISSGANFSYPVITTGTSITLSFSSTVKQKLYLATNKQETIVCTMNLIVSGQVSVTFFKLNPDGISLTNVGGVSTTDNTTTFQKDLAPGEYYLCFAASTISTYGSFVCTFSGFVTETRLSGKAWVSEQMVADLQIQKRERICNEPMTFSLVSGRLPPGCVLQVDGSITGTLPDLDCISKNIPVDPAPFKDPMLIDDSVVYDPVYVSNNQYEINSPEVFSPSVNWFYEDNEERWRPRPRRWVFRARVKLVNFPHITAEENFSVEVYNDWTKDRDAFMADAAKGFDRFQDIVIETKPDKINPNMFVNATNIPTEVTSPGATYIAACDACGETEISRDAEFARWYINDYINSTNPSMNEFIEKFKATPRFKDIAKIYGNSSMVESTINNTITTTMPTDGTRSATDIDFLFLEIGRRLNMSLPIEAYGHSGEALKAEIQ